MGFFSKMSSAFMRRTEGLKKNEEYFPDSAYKEVENRISDLDECVELDGEDLSGYVDQGMVDNTRDKYIEYGENSIQDEADKIDALKSMVDEGAHETKVIKAIAGELNLEEEVTELTIKEQCLEAISKALELFKKCYPKDYLLSVKDRLNPLFEILENDVMDLD
jgi:hypothetical protein